MLVVDDESAIRQVISKTLRGLGFDTFESARGEEAVSLIGLSQFDAVLLDINMPGMGGIAACRAIRKIAPTLPILMLTVRDAEDDKVEALEAGADDYVTKPFAVRELVARVKAVVRRAQPIDKSSNGVIAIGEMEIHSNRRVFLKRGTVIHLTPTEFDIVHYLMRHQGRAVGHRKLLSSIWGVEFRDQVEYLRTYMRQLRRKIEDDPAHPRYLLTDPYVGYRFRDGAASQPSLPAVIPEPNHDHSLEEHEWLGAS
nr:response regulator transcription factor [Granulicella arctica]